MLFRSDFLKLTHGNYHAWVPQMTAELQCLRVWYFCTGDESNAIEKPTLMTLLANASTYEKLMAQRNLSEAIWYYNDAYCWNAQAVGTIMTKIKPSEYSGLKNKLAKEVWCLISMTCKHTHRHSHILYKSGNATKEVH